MDENKMLEAQQRLAEIMNDTPHLVDVGSGQPVRVTRLKNGTQYLICEEACKIQMQENAAFGDVMKCFAANMPAIVRVLALATLNDKGRIFADGNPDKGYSDEFRATCDTFMWEIGDEALTNLLIETLSMLDVNFFLTSSAIVKTMREMMTKRQRQQNS